ncbi:MAG: delta-lactam-biosynthetic de-N-acetylase [Eubacteriales bacterium]
MIIMLIGFLPSIGDVSSVTAAANVDNWGLSFGESGTQPTGNATKEFLSQYDAYYVGDENDKTIYLTFDAGYENGNTDKILDTLKEKNVKAAFFLVGNYIERNPDLVCRMVEEGHIVGNHTYSHPDMSKISSIETFTEEMTKLEELFTEVTGKTLSKYYRPPQGKFSELNLQYAKKLGYKTIFWSLAYVDWYQDDQPTKEDALSKLIPRCHPGAIILLHSTSSTNASILGDLIDEYQKAGYTFKTLDDLTQ